MPMHEAVAQKVVAIVDDDAASLAAVSGLIDALGFATYCFRHPLDFLASPDLRVFDALVTDIRLPGMSGVTLLHRLRSVGNRMPVIAITAYPDEATRQLALRCGALACLAKPVAPDELLAWLDRAIG
ncbi:response regulator transcription factor [Ancylobacter sp. VNQ12]|uniref:response regulator transcription factor n=1 Tax=Ancylobacter sp. VNQ12 TaxID=3400920 RepID=UPI003C10BDB3